MTTHTRPRDTSTGNGIQQGISPLSQSVDWFVSLLLALVGGILVYGGVILYAATDRATLARWVADGRLMSDVLSDAELIEVTSALGVGGGIGIAITGGMLVVAGVAFHRIERRARRQFEATGTVAPNVVGSAILGAFVTIVTSFLVVSPVIGGAVASYVDRQRNGSGYKAASLSGVFAAVPVVVLFGVIIAAVAVGSPRLAPLVGGVFLVAVAAIVGLSTLGGYISTSLAREQN